jgi:hypothetical protein
MFLETLPGELPVSSFAGGRLGPPLGQPNPNIPESLQIEIQVDKPPPFPPPYTVHVVIDPTINNTMLHTYDITGAKPNRTVATISVQDKSVDASFAAAAGEPRYNGTVGPGTANNPLSLGSRESSGKFTLTTKGKANGCLYRVSFLFSYTER